MTGVSLKTSRKFFRKDGILEIKRGMKRPLKKSQKVPALGRMSGLQISFSGTHEFPEHLSQRT